MLFQGKGLNKVYAKRRVLDLEDFALESDRIHALLGPNGAGKTTLLHILSFLEHPSGGKLYFSGNLVDFRSRSQLRRLRREVVLVEQHPILFTTSVETNVGYGLKVRGVSKAKRRRIVQESLDLVGMRGFLGYPAWRLSGGETQRVALARALACSPRVLCLDEPTANVDVEHQVALEGIIRDIHAHTGKSLILCTHNHHLASKLAHNRLYLSAGRLSVDFCENVFLVRPGKDSEGRCVCSLGKGLDLPLKQTPMVEGKIALDPKSLRIEFQSAGEGAAASWPGRIVQIAEAGPYVRLEMDVGLPVHVLTKKGAASESPFQVGQRAFLTIPEQAIQIL